MDKKNGMKQELGCWANERWETEVALSPSLSKIFNIGWTDLHNRHERLSRGEGKTQGYVIGRILRFLQWPVFSPV